MRADVIVSGLYVLEKDFAQYWRVGRKDLLVHRKSIVNVCVVSRQYEIHSRCKVWGNAQQVLTVLLVCALEFFVCLHVLARPAACH